MRWICLVEKGKYEDREVTGILKMTFQGADVKKPLASVMRIVEKGKQGDFWSGGSWELH